MHFDAHLDEDDLALLQDAVQCIFELMRAEGRELPAELITARLCELFFNGERDPQKMAEAVMTGGKPLFH
jgi:hypothetical protein